MLDDGMTRKLAAILAADIVGYSRLMNEDEEETIKSWRAARRDVIDPNIASYSGRIVKHTGDGFLDEFNSVANAVCCALNMQTELSARNVGVPKNRRLDFRMGINVGDIVVEDDYIQGDEVNIAARLEGLAEPGGICISGDVLPAGEEQARSRLPWHHVREQARLKNDANRVEVKVHQESVDERLSWNSGRILVHRRSYAKADCRKWRQLSCRSFQPSGL